ncbi:MAG: hypothetical protein K0R48_89 [Gammaproteobacteria bacterium]|jgi:hypothetical protein|nr:hypothetical protein [Gammaproteobacteria bacterium]
MKILSLLSVFILFTVVAHAAPTEKFLFLGGNDTLQLAQVRNSISRSDIAGVQMVYSWQSLEPEEGQYDFTQIEKDLRFLNSLHKELFIQIQDRFFEPQAKYIPSYLLKDPKYKGGLVPQWDKPGENKPLVMGWVAQQWNPTVRTRYQALLRALAMHFDGKVYGINLPETAIDIDMKHDQSGFTCDRYFDAEIDNITLTRKVFKHSYVVQYVNFFPCEWNNDHNYMGRLFDYAVQNHIGLGGPDVVPYKKGQMKNSYPFFHQYRGKLVLVVMAIQQPTHTYINPQTKKPFSDQELQDFAHNYLGANIISSSISK